MGLEYFSFADLWSPVMMVISLLIILLYSLVVGPWRERFNASEPVSKKRQAAFIAGIVLLYLAQGGPLSLMGHLMFTFHMTAMAISYFIVPAMLIYGVPAWLWRSIFSRPFWRPLRFLMNPLFGLFAFNLLFSVYHMPANHDWIMTHYVVHGFYYFVMLGAAMISWWHIMCPVAEWSRLTNLRKLGFIFLNGLLLTPACVLIIFASTPLFSVYNDPEVWTRAMGYCISGNSAEFLSQFKGGPAFFSLMAPTDDQQLGGIIMKLLQEFVNIAALYTVFMQWYRKERAQDDDPSFDHASSSRLNNV
ncbi:cytochrome c oxidase assembly factor CtaG [Cohnella hashimotonis]|uniref:Cytochrome c oxidase assembly factor CtaG n=1 Tax=Cohnella hashimotonis TaxID=2826895 RepID=A0ABT6TNQ3_9BACL|nr:cytochrome c oxidase assembly factor CtaG [Cohnella hashimotonis]MDI4648487.1 cytochrome c oxidase assembly factor CtaG [Cohnella hashimotonis]